MGFYVFFGKSERVWEEKMGWDGNGRDGKRKRWESVCDCERRLISVCVEMLEKTSRE